MKFFSQPFVAAGTIISIALVIGLCVIGWGISTRGADNVIDVTGSASQNAVADQATWVINLQQTASIGSIAYASGKVAADADAIAQYLNSQNLASSSVTTAVVSNFQNYSSEGNPTTYNISDSVTISTSDVNAIDKLSHHIDALESAVSTNTIVSVQPPQYFISDLPDLRVSLLGAAITDARARATEITKSGGSSVGPLQTASSGSVQVSAPNSANFEGGGQYDTSTIQKQVTVTVRASFYVR